MRKILVLFLLPGALVAASSTQQLIRGGARSLAMGEGGAAALSGAESIYWNPAGLKGERTGEINAGHTSWGDLGLISETLADCTALGERGAFGFSGQFDLISGLETRDGSGFVTGQTAYSLTAVKLGYAHEAVPGLSLGLSGGMANEDLAGYRRSGFGGEGGLLGTYGPLRFGASGGLYPSGSTAYQGSVAYIADLAGGTFTLAGGAIIEGPDSRASLGFEHDLGPLALRAGYQIPLGTVKTVGLSSLTAGLGARIQSLDFDYAILPLGDLGLVHRVQVGYRFGKASADHDAKSSVGRAEEEPPAAKHPAADDVKNSKKKHDPS